MDVLGELAAEWGTGFACNLVQLLNTCPLNGPISIPIFDLFKAIGT